MISAARITSRTYRAYRRKRSIKDARLSLLFVSLLKTEVFVFFFGANRKDVSQKSNFSLVVFASDEKESPRSWQTHKKKKKREREKNREADISSWEDSWAETTRFCFLCPLFNTTDERGKVRFFFNHTCKRRKKEEKTGLIRPLVLACNHLTSSRHVLRSVVRTNTKLRDAEDTQKARTREQETWYKNR